jgi:Co/Zn/Cd efflux system component
MLTTSVLVIRLVGVLLSDSLALAADAAHAATDAAGLGIALVAASLALRPATVERTRGYRRALRRGQRRCLRFSWSPIADPFLGRRPG